MISNSRAANRCIQFTDNFLLAFKSKSWMERGRWCERKSRRETERVALISNWIDKRVQLLHEMARTSDSNHRSNYTHTWIWIGTRQQGLCIIFTENPIFIDNFMYKMLLWRFRFIYSFIYIYLFMNAYACVNDFTQLFCKYWSLHMITVGFTLTHMFAEIFSASIHQIYFEASEKSNGYGEKLTIQMQCLLKFCFFESPFSDFHDISKLFLSIPLNLTAKFSLVYFLGPVELLSRLVRIQN